jgi:hypothetical protein
MHIEATSAISTAAEARGKERADRAEGLDSLPTQDAPDASRSPMPANLCDAGTMDESQVKRVGVGLGSRCEPDQRYSGW